MISATLHGLAALLVHDKIDGLVQGCSISSALAMEIRQSCPKPLRYSYDFAGSI